MSFFDVLILSIVEGITEFLPVSSTGHMTIVMQLLDIPTTDFTTTFMIVIQLGAMMAIVGLYAKRLLFSWSMIRNTCVAFLPTGLVGFLGYSILRPLLHNPWITVGSLIVGGIVMIIVEYSTKNRVHQNNVYTIENLSLGQAFMLGWYQVIALIPGVSRSASTIIGARLQGYSRLLAIEFSFLLGLPTIFSASVYDMVKQSWHMSITEYGMIALGSIIAGSIAWYVVSWMRLFVEKSTFISFGIYRIGIAVVFALVMII